MNQLKYVNNRILIILFCTSHVIWSDYEANEDKDDKDPPKIDKLAFVKMHNAIPDTAKMHLKSGKIVEDVLFDFAKDMEHEQ